MIGHLGARVSALLDGQLSAEETERAWEHVHACHQCRDLVEREGWVKTRLAGLAFDPTGAAPADLKGALLGASALARSPLEPALGPREPVHRDSALLPGDSYLAAADGPVPRRRTVGVAMGGGAAVGAAVMGVLALGVAPADAPTLDRRTPVTSVTQPAGPQSTTPTRSPQRRAPLAPAPTTAVAFWQVEASR